VAAAFTAGLRDAVEVDAIDHGLFDAGQPGGPADAFACPLRTAPP
jgi:hypothetical protein